jgi:hypothetical protein
MGIQQIIKMKLHYFIFILFLIEGCGDKCDKNLKFEIPITLTPVQSEYKIGDTITIVSKFSKSMIDVVTNESIKVENYNFGVIMYIIKNDDRPGRFAYNYFNIVSQIGKLELQTFQISDTTKVGGTNGLGGTYQIVYKENTDEYLIKYKIIPKKNGLYDIHFGSLALKEDSGLIKNCHSTVDFLQFNVNGGTNNHYEFLQQSPNENTRILPKEELSRNGYYAFYVK